VTSENPTNDKPVPPATQTKRNSDDKANDPQGAHAPTIGPEVQVPPSHENYKISCDKKRDGWDKAKLFAEFVGIVFLIIYTLYTAGIYCANQRAAQAAQDTLGEIQKQTTLMRQQLIGTQAAVLQIAEAQWDGRGTLNMQIQNLGPSNARILHSSAHAKRISLPTETQIGEAVDLTIPSQTLRGFNSSSGGSGINPHWQVPWPMPSGHFNDSHPWPGNEAVIVEGSITYFDGFEETTQPFCWAKLPEWQVPSVSGFTYSNNFRGGDKCDIPSLIKDFQRIEEWAKQERITGKRHQ
jgi:hypothetical protein